jgi:Zinc-binding
MCQVCRQTFMANARPPLLYQHVVAKHPVGTDPLTCFPIQLQGFDPNDPNGEKKVTTSSTNGATVKPKVVKKKDDGLDALLDAGLKKK